MFSKFTLDELRPILRSSTQLAENIELATFVGQNWVKYDSQHEGPVNTWQMNSQPAKMSYQDDRFHLIRIEASSLSTRRNVNKTMVHVKPVQFRTREDQSLTQIPELILAKLGTPLKVLDIAPTADTYSQFVAGTGPASVQGRAIAQHSSWIDTVGSICLVSNDENIANAVKTALATKAKHTAVKFHSLFKAKDTTYGVTELKQSQILKGQCLIPIQYAAQRFNQLTHKFETVEIVALAIFQTAKRIKKYSKSRKAFLEIADALQTDGFKWIDPHAYTLEVHKVASTFAHWWGGALNILPLEELKDIPHWDREAAILKSGRYIDNTIYHALSQKNIMLNSQEHKRVQRADEALAKTLTHIDTINAAATTHDATTVSYQRHIAASVLNIARVQASIDEIQVKLDSLIAEHNQGLSTLEALVASAEALKTQQAQETLAYTIAYDLKVAEALDDAPDMFGNLYRTGIIITDIICTHKTSGAITSVHLDKHILHADNTFISEICFITTKPINIYVDRATPEEQIRVGGPYEVRVLCAYDANGAFTPTMYIRPASINAVFGYKRIGNTFKVKPHPHSQDLSINANMNALKRFSEGWTATCLGEIAPSLSKAFKQHNPKLAVNAALAWLTSAYSKDEWGQTYDWFPTPDEVNFNGYWSGKPDETSTEINQQVANTTGIDDIAASIAAAIARQEPVEATVSDLNYVPYTLAP